MAHVGFFFGLGCLTSNLYSLYAMGIISCFSVTLKKPLSIKLKLHTHSHTNTVATIVAIGKLLVASTLVTGKIVVVTPLVKQKNSVANPLVNRKNSVATPFAIGNLLVTIAT